MTVYLDTSLLVGFFIATDAFAGRANSFFTASVEVPVVSDFVADEFASVIARLNRTATITAEQARETFALFDN